jgi:hypothetical protein
MKREKKFTMMFSDEEFTKARELATRKGLSLSAFLRAPIYEDEKRDGARARPYLVRRRQS